MNGAAMHDNEMLVFSPSDCTPYDRQS